MKLPAAFTENPKTTLTGLVGAICVLGARWGLHLSLDEQGAIVLLLFVLLSIHSKDS
jgi:hypothetical protein